MHNLKIIVLISLFSFFSNVIWSNDITLNLASEIAHISQDIELLPCSDHQFSLQDVFTQKFLGFEKYKNQIQANETYWGRFHIENKTSGLEKNTDWILEMPIVLTDIEFYVVNGQNVLQKGRSGQFVPIKQRTFAPILKANLFKISITPGDKISLYFKAKSDRKKAIPNFNTTIQASEIYFIKLKNERLIQGLFIGFMLMMFVYNLFLYFFNAQDKAYINYSIYILGIMLYSSYNTGLLADISNALFLPNYPKYSYFGKTSTYMVIFGYLYFLRTFLHLESLLPKWNNVLRFIIWINFLAFIVDVLLMLITNFNSDIADIVTVGNAIIFVLFIFTICFSLYKTKDKKSYFIIAGILLMGIGAVFTIIARINGTNYSTAPFQIGTILEVIIFSLGLAYRRRRIENEKQQANYELQKAQLLRDQEQKEAERLKEIDLLKSKFYTNITHEFRTPLTLINGNLDLIADHESEKIAIKKNSDQMLRLVNQVLDLSKLEANMLEVNNHQSDIVVYIHYITESFRSLANGKHILLEFKSPKNVLVMDFDRDKIEHIMYNLISNAIKFTAEGGIIQIFVEKIFINDKPMLEVIVKDTGVGIAKEQIPYIFDRYHELNINSNIGTGIGLAFVKELVHILKGQILVTSEIGHGSEFKVLLPVKNESPLVDSHPSIDSTSQFEHTIPYTDRSELIEDKPILLLIEDNREIAEYIQKILQNKYKMHIAYDGEDGIQQAILHVPDIIISDVIMPKKNGYQVTHSIKNNSKTSHIPIILLTAKATQSDKVEGLESGADSYLTKPFDKEELIIRLRNIQKQRIVLIQKFKEGFFKSPKEFKIEQDLTKEDIFLQSIRDVLIENIENSSFGVDEIVLSLGMSKNQFYRKLKALIGETPTKFVRNIRLHEAQRLLQTTHLNVSEIAYKVGFVDPNYFSRMFQKKFGSTPSKYSSK